MPVSTITVVGGKWKNQQPVKENMLIITFIAFYLGIQEAHTCMCAVSPTTPHNSTGHVLECNLP